MRLLPIILLLALLSVAVAEETGVPYWIEQNFTGNPYPDGKIWTKANLTAGTNMFYAYNCTVAKGNGTNVFWGWDNFNNTNIYVVSSADSEIAVGNGVLSWTGINTDEQDMITMLLNDGQQAGATFRLISGPANTTRGPNVGSCFLGMMDDDNTNCFTYAVGGAGNAVFSHADAANVYTRRVIGAGVTTASSAKDIYTTGQKYWDLVKNGTSQEFRIWNNAARTSQNYALPLADAAVTGLNYIMPFSSYNIPAGQDTVSGDIRDFIALMNTTPTGHSINVTYGAKETGTWTVGGESCNARWMMNASSSGTFKEFQVGFDYATFNETKVSMVKYSEGNVKTTVVISGTHETGNTTAHVYLQSVTGNLEDYNLTFTYNNTPIGTVQRTGLAQVEAVENFSITAPLIDTNKTLISYLAQVNVTANGGKLDQDNVSGTQEVLLAYTFDTATFTKGSTYTVEAANTVTVITPPKPASANWPANVTGSAWMQGCNQTNGTGYAVNNTCPSGMLTLASGGFNFTLSPTHTSNSGIVHVDYLVNQSWNVTFNMTAESTSSKRLNRAWNASRDYIVWLVNESNQSINGAGNINTTLNVTFYDESNNTNISIENMLATFAVRFTDGTFKNFTVSYTGMFGEGWVRGHPAFYTANVSSFEVYSKTGYTTRSRFMVQAATYLGTRQDVKVYMLEESKADYLIINVVDSGNAVVGAYVQILKYYGAGTYLNVEQKITNVNGQAGAYLELDAYYKFAVYDSTGGQLYMSANPEQFVCVSGTCSITIDISGSSPLYFMTPYYSASCYGINATESIAFNFADQTGNTHNIRFRAWRSTNITGLGSAAVCDQTASASSASYVCTLAPPENFTTYAYTCAVDI